MKRIFLTLAAVALVAAACSTKPAGPTPEERASELISKLSLEQKVSLMLYESPAIPEMGIHQYNWWNEALHGAARAGLATVFPQSIAMASSFDPELLQEVFDIASTEQRIKFNQARSEDDVTIYHGLTAWTPNINIFRDPRWGRGQETYGEDPFLTATMGRSVVNGLQGPENNKVAACLKHFAVHSGPESSRHKFDASGVSFRDLNETYFYAFKNLVQTTEVKQVMCAYNAFEGEPCCGNNNLMNKILRDEWGYKWLVVTDCWAVADTYSAYGHNNFPGDTAAAVSKAVMSGADLECGESYGSLVEGVKRGLIAESDIDKALARAMTLRYELGEMDWEANKEAELAKYPESLLSCEAHKAKALEMARESMVLLQNDGTLPLAKSGAKYAVAGPNADDEEILWGNYNGEPSETTSILEGIVSKVGKDNVVYAKGCELAHVSGAKIPSYDVSGLADADVIIYVGGISPRIEGEEMGDVNFEGFVGGDRTSIELPATQRVYVQALASLGKPIVFVNVSGSAIALAPEAALCGAVLQAWYAGEKAGDAVADVLFGDYNPSGKLPVTFYASNDDLPDFECYDMAGRTYRYFEGKALYPFGHGLSYTTFAYGGASLKKDVLTVEVSNTGAVDGDEVVEVYVRRNADAEGPAKSLRGFKRVSLKAGETRKVSVPVSFDLYDETAGAVVDLPGEYTISYGGSSADEALSSITVKR